MADGDSWDAESFEPDKPLKNAAANDKWEGEDEEDDIKDNWDEEEEEEEKSAEKPTELKASDKKKLNEKIKEKENLQRQKQEELRKRIEEPQEAEEPEEPEEAQLTPEEAQLTPEEERAETHLVESLQEDADLELASETLGGVSNHVTGIDAISPASREDFTEFEKLLKDKISPYEKSIHYSNFLESLFKNLCISVEVEDLKKINTSMTALLSEKQRQEKQSKGHFNVCNVVMLVSTAQ
ncbi:eukaryotic translation initiation factor 3 subunit J-A isoform X2 [Sardina pilchardus]|uniref:eukaryotic translation initiation factor 3 subunit J-A isoform X2 n=1 Tax=Sardina pilchardus TaxID=27697 RepID=UPI002E147BC9